MKMVKRLLAALLCLTMVLAPLTMAVSAAEGENIALHKTAEVSGYEGGVQADGQPVNPKFSATGLTDGDMTTRWSSDTVTAENPAWVVIDLGAELELSSINLYWKSANDMAYDVLLSSNQEAWTTIKTYTNYGSTMQNYCDTLALDNSVKAQYVKVLCRPNGQGAEPSSASLYEIEIIAPGKKITANDMFKEIRSGEAVFNSDYTRLELPELSSKNFTPAVYATSNPAVIGLDGTVHQPLNDMVVNVFYQLTEKDGNVVKHDKPKAVLVPGKYSAEESLQPKPMVLPDLREWKGNEGTFTFTGDVVIADEALRATAEQVVSYFTDMLGLTPAIVCAETPKAGDIFLKLDPQSLMGAEGYEMEIADTITVTALEKKGILYGGVTLTQIFSQAADHASMPKGLIRDYPQYEIRSIMVDVARKYIPLDHLQEITRYAAYYKINEMHIHINDNFGEQWDAFRVKSDVYPMINNGIPASEVYGKEEYKAYQKDVKAYGIDVVTEIDTPAHAACFAYIDKDIMMGSQLDLSNPKTTEVIKALYDEYLDGEDPVFQNNKFHIGTDEYPKNRSEEVRAYMDTLIKYVNAKGYEPRFWASLGRKGFDGVTPVSNQAIAHLWNHGLCDFNTMKKSGYKFINNNDRKLYVVPGFETAYNAYLNVKELYESWEVTDLGSIYTLAAGHPQLVGAEAALWNDWKVGASEFDVFNLLKDQIIIISEKTWSGTKRPDQTGDAFMKRVEAVTDRAPNTNPGRFVESKGETLAQFHFAEIRNGEAVDLSGNGYNALLHDLKTGTDAQGSYLKLNGQGYLSLPFASVGYPYTVSMDVTVDPASDVNAKIFTGKDGTLFWNYDGTGRLGFERDRYRYLFDYTVPTNEKINITLVCDEFNTTLYVNGIKMGTPKYYKETVAEYQDYSTFVLPTEQIGSQLYGKLYSLTILNHAGEPAGSETDVRLDRELASQNQTVTSEPQTEGLQNAVDGDEKTTVTLSDSAWITVDLGKDYVLTDSTVLFTARPESYDLQVSSNGTDWTPVKSYTGLEAGAEGKDTHAFETLTTARYVRYQQTAGTGTVAELQVYGYAADVLQKAWTDARDILKDTQITDSNRAFLAAFRADFDRLTADLKAGKLDILRFQMICDYTDCVRRGDIPQDVADKSMLEEQLNVQLNQSGFTSDTWAAYEKTRSTALEIYKNVTVGQESVNAITEELIANRQNLNMVGSVYLSSNCYTYGIYTFDNVVDGDKGTYCLTDASQMVGDYFTFRFRDKQNLSKIEIFNGTRDQIGAADVELSMDGVHWNKVGTITAAQVNTVEFPAQEAYYVRLTITAQSWDWVQMNEVQFNGQPNGADKVPLTQKLETLTQLKQADYTAESFGKLDTAITDARAVLAKEKPTQKELNDALAAVNTAKAGLEKVTAYQVLEDLLKVELPADPYTPDSYAVYTQAREQAQKLCTEKNATQHQVNAAAYQLRDAMESLVKNGNPQKLNVIGSNMTLGNALAMNFYVQMADVQDPAGLSLQITKTFANGKEPVVVNVPFAQWTAYNGNYQIGFDDISAKEMTDDIRAVVLREGQPAGDIYTDSVEKYALRILRGGNCSEKLSHLIVDMLNYGAEAQTKFDYNTAVPANAELTEQEQALASAPAEIQNVQQKGEHYYGSNLNLGNSMALTVYFQDITPDMHAVISYTKHTGEKKEITVSGADFIRYKSDVYGIRADTLVVADAQQSVTVTVYDAQGNVFAQATDSIASYVGRNTKLGQLGEAIMKFAASAKTYFAER